MDLTEYRAELDALDAELISLLTRRMAISQEIALWKQANGIPVLDAVREREKLAAIVSVAAPSMEGPLTELFTLLFRLSRERQEAVLTEDATWQTSDS